MCLYTRKIINNDPEMTLYIEDVNILSHNNPIPNPNHEKTNTINPNPNPIPPTCMQDVRRLEKMLILSPSTYS